MLTILQIIGMIFDQNVEIFNRIHEVWFTLYGHLNMLERFGDPNWISDLDEIKYTSGSM